MAMPSWAEWTGAGLGAFCTSLAAFGVAYVEQLEPWREYIVAAGVVCLFLTALFSGLAVVHSPWVLSLREKKAQRRQELQRRQRESEQIGDAAFYRRLNNGAAALPAAGKLHAAAEPQPELILAEIWDPISKYPLAQREHMFRETYVGTRVMLVGYPRKVRQLPDGRYELQIAYGGNTDLVFVIVEKTPALMLLDDTSGALRVRGTISPESTRQSIVLDPAEYSPLEVSSE